jgi:hypothetical protein
MCPIARTGYEVQVILANGVGAGGGRLLWRASVVAPMANRGRRRDRQKVVHELRVNFPNARFWNVSDCANQTRIHGMLANALWTWRQSLAPAGSRCCTHPVGLDADRADEGLMCSIQQKVAHELRADCWRTRFLESIRLRETLLNTSHAGK